MTTATEKKPLTARDVGREALRLAELYPNARYQQVMRPESDAEDTDSFCFYTVGDVEAGPPGVCGCLFGQAIRNLCGDKPGVDIILKEADAAPEGTALTVLLRRLNIAPVETDSRLCRSPKMAIPRALEASQGNQDRGMVWGKAVEPLRIYFAQPELIPVHTITLTDEELRIVRQGLNYASDRSFGLLEEQQYNGLLQKLPMPGEFRES